MDALRVRPHNAIPGAQHPHAPEVVQWTKCTDELFHGQLGVARSLVVFMQLQLHVPRTFF